MYFYGWTCYVYPSSWGWVLSFCWQVFHSVFAWYQGCSYSKLGGLWLVSFKKLPNLRSFGYGEALTGPPDAFVSFCCPASPWWDLSGAAGATMHLTPIGVAPWKEACIPAEDGGYQAVWLAMLFVYPVTLFCIVLRLWWPIILKKKHEKTTYVRDSYNYYHKLKTLWCSIQSCNIPGTCFPLNKKLHFPNGYRPDTPTPYSVYGFSQFPAYIICNLSYC